MLVPLKISQNHRKTPVLESLFNEAAVFQHRRFPVNSAKFFKNTYLVEHGERLLLVSSWWSWWYLNQEDIFFFKAFHVAGTINRQTVSSRFNFIFTAQYHIQYIQAFQWLKKCRNKDMKNATTWGDVFWNLSNIYDEAYWRLKRFVIDVWEGPKYALDRVCSFTNCTAPKADLDFKRQNFAAVE